mmetsp:Transcript_12739/g.34601  ORF Transcript_12739/g.34601 Transcript_12739/m.34601 type:complete len:697 (-) Transcript_12739:533-2623(-)
MGEAVGVAHAVPGRDTHVVVRAAEEASDVVRDGLARNVIARELDEALVARVHHRADARVVLRVDLDAELEAELRAGEETTIEGERRLVAELVDEDHDPREAILLHLARDRNVAHVAECLERELHVQGGDVRREVHGAQAVALDLEGAAEGRVRAERVGRDDLLREAGEALHSLGGRNGRARAGGAHEGGREAVRGGRVDRGRVREVRCVRRLIDRDLEHVGVAEEVVLAAKSIERDRPHVTVRAVSGGALLRARHGHGADGRDGLEGNPHVVGRHVVGERLRDEVVHGEAEAAVKRSGVRRGLDRLHRGGRVEHGLVVGRSAVGRALVADGVPLDLVARDVAATVVVRRGERDLERRGRRRDDRHGRRGHRLALRRLEEVGRGASGDRVAERVVRVDTGVVRGALGERRDHVRARHALALGGWIGEDLVVRAHRRAVRRVERRERVPLHLVLGNGLAARRLGEVPEKLERGARVDHELHVGRNVRLLLRGLEADRERGLRLAVAEAVLCGNAHEVLLAWGQSRQHVAVARLARLRDDVRVEAERGRARHRDAEVGRNGIRRAVVVAVEGDVVRGQVDVDDLEDVTGAQLDVVVHVDAHGRVSHEVVRAVHRGLDVGRELVSRRAGGEVRADGARDGAGRREEVIIVAGERLAAAERDLREEGHGPLVAVAHRVVRAHDAHVAEGRELLEGGLHADL